jgi:hypothetical protein
MHNWLQSHPWWVKWAFMAGGGLMSAFAPAVIGEEWQAICFSIGAALIVVAALGSAWHGINALRQKRNKPKLMLEPNYLIIFGLTVALTGAVWQQLRGPLSQTPQNNIGAASKEWDSFTVGILPGNNFYVKTYLLNNKPDKKIIAVAFLKDTSKDDNDIMLQKSERYDYTRGERFFQINTNQDFKGRMHKGSQVSVVLLEVPDSVTPEQFSTLRQAEALGAKRVLKGGSQQTGISFESPR